MSLGFQSGSLCTLLQASQAVCNSLTLSGCSLATFLASPISLAKLYKPGAAFTPSIDSHRASNHHDGRPIARQTASTMSHAVRLCSRPTNAAEIDPIELPFRTDFTTSGVQTSGQNIELNDRLLINLTGGDFAFPLHHEWDASGHLRAWSFYNHAVDHSWKLWDKVGPPLSAKYQISVSFSS